MENYIIALLGKSGSGKDTMLAELEKRGYKRVVSCTTRPKREKEIEGRDYYFLTEKEFNNKMPNFIEYRKYNTFNKLGQEEVWHYGIENCEIDLSQHKYVVIVDYKGYKDLKQYTNQVFGIYIDAPVEQRLQRAQKRDPGFSMKEWQRREIDDMEVFKDLSMINAIVYNEDGHLDKAMDSIDSIIGVIELLGQK